jgi:translation initiation factor 1
MFEMGADLSGETWEKQKIKEPKKSMSKSTPNRSEKMSKNEHQLVFTFEKRRGKPVTLVGRFLIDEKEKKEILKLLKSKLCCGGTINNEWL